MLFLLNLLKHIVCIKKLHANQNLVTYAMHAGSEDNEEARVSSHQLHQHRLRQSKFTTEGKLGTMMCRWSSLVTLLCTSW
jgi:hypothetical protein